MLANLVVVMIFHHVIGGRMQRFFGEAIARALPLAEMVLVVRSAARGMGTYDGGSRTAQGRRREARRQVAGTDAAAGRRPDAAGAAAGARPRLVSSSRVRRRRGVDEARTRRHLRVIAAGS